MTPDIPPIALGLVLVAAAAVFALLPLARGGAPDGASPQTGQTERFRLYRQVLELEFDFQVGKLSAEDYASLSTELLGQAGEGLREERGATSALDEELEREIAAARAAFAAARQSSRPRAPTPAHTPR